MIKTKDDYRIALDIVGPPLASIWRRDLEETIEAMRAALRDHKSDAENHYEVSEAPEETFEEFTEAYWPNLAALPGWITE